jgi:hypothetical protein
LTSHRRFNADSVHEKIAYVATQCDKASLDLDELATNLCLDEDPEYEDIEARLEVIEDRIRAIMGNCIIIFYYII